MNLDGTSRPRGYSPVPYQMGVRSARASISGRGGRIRTGGAGVKVQCVGRYTTPRQLLGALSISGGGSVHGAQDDTSMGNPGSQDRAKHLGQLEEDRRRAAKPLPSSAQQRAQRLAGSHVVIVCGGRDYGDRDRVFAALDLAHGRRRLTLLVHGACLDRRSGTLLGADRWADEWARERGVPVEPHPADWRTWGKAAGPMRNRQMAEAGAHGCIAFPGGTGTANMCRWAERCGIAVWRPYG